MAPGMDPIENLVSWASQAVAFECVMAVAPFVASSPEDTYKRPSFGKWRGLLASGFRRRLFGFKVQDARVYDRGSRF